MKTYQQIVRDLRQVYPEGEARALARWLCEERFGLTQTDILLDKDNQLSADDLEKIREITLRLIHHEPIQYILGHTTFCGHQFYVAPGALIPRPETQEMVQHILSTLSPEEKEKQLQILDMGTGSGCIAFSLSLALPASKVTAWDISKKALAVAQHNLDLYPSTHVTLEQVDMLNPPINNCQWDIIVSNPPYICQSEAEAMEQNVLDYEPHSALFVPDADPLLFYRAIIEYAHSHLAPLGQLWMEINQRFGTEIIDFIEENTSFQAALLQDSFGHDRFVKALNDSRP